MMTTEEDAQVRTEARLLLIAEACLLGKAEEEVAFRTRPGREECQVDHAQSRELEEAYRMGAEVLERERRKLMGLEG